MKFGRTAAALCGALMAAGCQSTANTHWEQIGYGPTLEYANAQCQIAAMGTQQGVVAWGSPSYVAGAQIGNAIGNAIREAQFMKNCMVLQGWKQMPNAPASHYKPAPAQASRHNPAIEKNLMAFGSANNRCIKGDKSACAQKADLKKKLALLGVNPES